jgi:Zn-dependent protease
MFSLAPTPLDVRLMAFGIPIRVHPTFWIAMILLGWVPDAPKLVFIWVVCGFVSVLIHELGHAVTAELFGWPTEIILYFGGGLAISHRERNDTPLRSIAVSAMGPAAGFLLLIQVILLRYFVNRQGWLQDEYSFYVFRDLFLMNLFWGLLNILPVLPLDGGHILHSVCQMLRLRDPAKVTLSVSTVVAGLAAYYFLVQMHQQIAGIMMLMLCFQNASAIQSRRY